jgi:hypothetical protein
VAGSKSRVRVEKSRIVNTYAELWHGSNVLLSKAKATEDGAHWVSMASLILTAFALEAFLNHLGARVFGTWADMESLRPLQKLSVLCERLGVSFDTGTPPYQTLKTLVRFRNALAHGKTEKLSPPPTHHNAESVAAIMNSDRVLTDWERLCTSEYAERARKDLEEVVEQLHKAAKITDESPFMMGLGMRSASLVNDS